ncbi:phosphoribosylformylglycinamidine synthase subunit PurQ [Gemmatimonas sp.]|uniref:phosphoribosylformylglycinamidine synthase subunit PurQ n=2 Tax=Gemmatimonas sp. TaxID=1962908 RepID=UPI0025B932EC|nr:phosphoribosylformylglycinamidine synthase subunit PurQ [Gemmatimonas sp.]MCA2982393.1 phosphoribosylformylglycinamidine synthase subunit PurQ [Gemmatimonas sp.]MCA2989241.1 phosphoribosylformylglycinamidine synthase subunit PurQ [Gemmatimonas sp.]MCA2990395.1 phosphoribosylformylglycinamidine synthase subunit PurQ [Gemmatimonas sp.]MCA2994138.1 phosphoribosylformylglycinamidine synthase subunit PurQ [Gemmatimonas sp.]
MKAGIVRFPGSNCDEDAFHAVADILGQDAVYLWHKDHDLQGVDLVILPGGFSYGDYLRAGAIARFSPIMKEVVQHANRGGLVLGICNGFQIACEAGLLPGALLRNDTLRFVSAPVTLRVESIATRFTSQYHLGQQIRIPVAHGDGRYTADGDVLARLEGEGHVVFRYVDANGEPTGEANPNGSLRNIAGIVSEAGNVLGMMPHPERAMEAALGSTDGLPLFTSIVESLLGGVAA